MQKCSECGNQAGILHSNAVVGFTDLCDDCQVVAHSVFNATRTATLASRIRAAIAAAAASTSGSR